MTRYENEQTFPLKHHDNGIMFRQLQAGVNSITLPDRAAVQGMGRLYKAGNADAAEDLGDACKCV